MIGEVSRDRGVHNKILDSGSRPAALSGMFMHLRRTLNDETFRGANCHSYTGGSPSRPYLIQPGLPGRTRLFHEPLNQAASDAIRPGMEGSESARNHPASAISVGSSASSPSTYSAVKPNMSEFGNGQG